MYCVCTLVVGARLRIVSARVGSVSTPWFAAGKRKIILAGARLLAARWRWLVRKGQGEEA